MILKIKSLFKTMLWHYYQIVNLHTGYKNNSLIFMSILFIIGLCSMLLNKDIFENITNPDILNILLLSGIINGVYLQFNLGCRLTITI